MVGLSPNFWYKYQFPAYFTVVYTFFLGFPGFPCGSAGKESACNVGDLGSIPRLERPLGRTWQPTPVLLPGEFHGERSRTGCSPWNRKELETTLQLTFTFTFMHFSGNFK